jgi:hypothetical protein
MRVDRIPASEDRERQGSCDPPESLLPQVFCRCELHAGWFPVAGLRLSEARLMLAPHLGIDAQAKAVIDGRVADEDAIIGRDVKSLTFVRISSQMGG